MNIYINKKLILSLLAIILVSFQGFENSILIDAALIFVTLGLVKISKDNKKKFDTYAYTFVFILFIMIFILKAFIL